MKEITVTFTKEEAEELEFYLRWSDRQLFGDYERSSKDRVVIRIARKKVRRALAATKEKTEVDLLEKMLGPDVKPE